MMIHPRNRWTHRLRTSGDRSDRHMTLGGHGIGRREVYQGIGPQRRRCGIAAMLVLLSAFVSSDLHAASTDSVRLQIAGAIAGAGAILDQSAVAHGGAQALQSVYSGSGNAPLWSREGRATRQAEALLLELQNAQAYGLEAEDYQGNEIGELVNRPPSSAGSDDERWAGVDV